MIHKPGKSHFPNLLLVFSLLLAAAATLFAFTFRSPSHDRIISYTADPKKQEVRLYWKDDSGKILGSIQNLKSYLDKKQKSLLFAANAGMYMEDQHPLGLFVQEGKTITKLNTRKGGGNFYMLPNGVLYLTGDKQAGICKTELYSSLKNIRFATQSGPLLLIDGAIHPAFTKGSTNLNIRNGAGILPDGRVLFAMSKEPINFYDLALYFKEMGCRNALYLDGFVSRTYLPEKSWTQLDGNFGVMIGVSL